MRRLIATATTLLAIVASADRVDGTTYTVQDLGTLGGECSQAMAINDAGQIVGRADVTHDVHRAFLYDGFTMRDLGTLGGESSAAMDINESGTVVGSSRTHPGTFSRSHAFRYQDGGMVDLDPVEETYSWASAINNSGTVVGWCDPGADPGHYVFLHDGAIMRLLPEISGGYPAGYGIDDSGVVVCGIPSANDDHAALWDGSTVLDLGEVAIGGRSSSALDINEFGAVVGQVGVASAGFRPQAFLYDGSTVTELGTLGGDVSTAWSINDLGDVVGQARIAGGGYEDHAFIFEDGKMSDLNDLLVDRDGWMLTDARDINNLGQIVGWGLHNGVQRAFVLTPVPEPSTLALLGIGGLALLACRRPRRSGRGRPVPLS